MVYVNNKVIKFLRNQTNNKNNIELSLSLSLVEIELIL